MHGFIGKSELRTEPLVGWRSWRVRPGRTVLSELCLPGQKTIFPDAKFPELALTSQSSVVYPWQPEETNVAKHLWRPHDCKGLVSKNCGCGFWAYKNLALFRRCSAYQEAVGRVSLWGKVVVGTLGYRAEKAYPLDIWLPESMYDSDAQKIRDIYKIDVFRGRPWNDPDVKEGK